jgi:hypothetical protein
MTDERLIADLLSSVVVPDTNAALQRTVVVARGAVAADGGERRPRGPRLALALTAIAAIVALSFSPPGRAIADDIARLIGIGGPPTVDHSDGDIATQADSSPIVIGEGVVPNGGPRFEIVAYEGRLSDAAQARFEQDTGRGFPAELLNQNVGTCVALDWPEKIDPRGGQICIDAPQRDPLPHPSITDYQAQLGMGGELAMVGLTGPEVDRVDVAYTDADGQRAKAPVTLAQLDDELAGRAGVNERFGFYVAFLPDQDVGAGSYIAPVMKTVKMSAYDSEGSEIKQLDYGAIVERQARREAESAAEVQQLLNHDRDVGAAEDPTP